MSASHHPDRPAKIARVRRLPPQKGFTLLELMFVIVIIAILTAIALPSYERYIRKSRAKAASADLAALALNLENKFQLQLTYPVFDKPTTPTQALFPGWAATQPDYFSYSLTSGATSYALTATGLRSLDGCVLTLGSDNKRTASDACGFTSW